MMQWKFVLVVLVALIATSAATQSANAAERLSDCRIRGTTVTATASTRLFSTFSRRTHARKYYACWLARRTTRYIGRRDLGDGVQPTLTLAGSRVVYEDINCDDGACNGSVFLYDVRRGPTAERQIAQLEEPGAPASDLLLTRSGAVAWIRPSTEGRRVVVVQQGTQTVVDVGEAIQPGTLALAGGRLYWTNGGTPRSIPLP